MRPARRAFDITSTNASGTSRTSSSAKLREKSRQSSQLGPRVIGTTRWRPLPPVVLTKLSRPWTSRRARTTRAAAITAGHRADDLENRLNEALELVARYGKRLEEIVAAQQG